MRKAEIEALVRAHRGRARPVAYFHVLRQESLEPDDHAFLAAHVDELGASDLLRWKARSEVGFTAPVIRELAKRAVSDPVQFQHEVLDVPRLDLDEHEWTELCDLLRGKVPAGLYARVLERGGARPKRPPPDTYFTPGVLTVDLGPLPKREAGRTDPIDPAELDALPMREIVAARKEGRLAIDEATLSRVAMERARASNEDWSVASVEFPGGLKEAVLERVRVTRSGDERANLLGWLEVHAVPRAALLSMALQPIRDGEVSFAIIGWLSRQLSTRAAWEKHGVETVSVLVRERAFAELGDLVTVALSEAARGDNEPPRGMLEAILGAFALALVDAAKTALAANHEPAAMAALSALACLDPPSRVIRAVHELREIRSASEAVSELIATNERLIKHSDGRDASLEGIIAAVHALADASR
jgi:hypothetical protein